MVTVHQLYVQENAICFGCRMIDLNVKLKFHLSAITLCKSVLRSMI